MSACEIKCSALDETLHDSAIHFGQIDPFAEIQQVFERPSFDPLLNHRLYGLQPYVLHCAQAEANFSFNDSEIRLAFIEVRRQDLDAHLAAFGDVLDGLVLIPHVLG
jgi:hypothetical protein